MTPAPRPFSGDTEDATYTSNSIIGVNWAELATVEENSSEDRGHSHHQLLLRKDRPPSTFHMHKAAKGRYMQSVGCASTTLALTLTAF